MKYFGYYNNGLDEKRTRMPAADGKMSYIAETLAGIDELEIISMSGTYTMETVRKAEYSTDYGKVRFFTSLSKRGVLSRALSALYLKYQLWNYCLKHVDKGETIVVYHSLGYQRDLYWLKRIKRFKMVLEMEEVYSDVNGASRRQRDKELFYAGAADAYVFPTQLLDELVNTEKKPSVIVHGTYRVEPDRGYKFDDGKIHSVYAGTLDPRKGGATAAAAAEHLPENYHVHILGFGSEKQIEDMKKLTQEISRKGKAVVTYDGLLSGEEYIRFIQACNIGLSTQNLDAAFNGTSFPSKVLSYMANGLRVVSVRIKAIETSTVGDIITYYDEQTPGCIANAIMSVDMSRPYDSRKRIAELDEQFQKDLRQLIEAK